MATSTRNVDGNFAESWVIMVRMLAKIVSVEAVRRTTSLVPMWTNTQLGVQTSEYCSTHAPSLPLPD